MVSEVDAGTIGNVLALVRCETCLSFVLETDLAKHQAWEAQLVVKPVPKTAASAYHERRSRRRS